MFSKSLLVSAFAALAYAQSSVLSFTRVPNPITAGEATAITYATNDTASAVTIILRKGPSGNLQTIATLTDSAIGGQYIWTPPTNLENGVNYALQITQGTQMNYFGPFQIQGASGSASSYAGSSAPVYGSSSSMSGYRNMTMTSSAAGAGATSNSTMSHGNGTSSSTRGATSTRAGGAGASSTGAPYQGGSATGSGAGAASTGGAVMIGASSVALVMGGAAAVLMGF